MLGVSSSILGSHCPEELVVRDLQWNWQQMGCQFLCWDAELGKSEDSFTLGLVSWSNRAGKSRDSRNRFHLLSSSGLK